MKEYHADTNYFFSVNIKPILNLFSIQNIKPNKISPETQYKCNIMSFIGQRKGMMTRDDHKWFGKPVIYKINFALFLFCRL